MGKKIVMDLCVLIALSAVSVLAMSDSDNSDGRSDVGGQALLAHVASVDDSDENECGDVEVAEVLPAATQLLVNDCFLREVRDYNVGQVEFLIRLKAQVDCQERRTGQTALHLVAGNSCADSEAAAQEIAEILINAQADVNAKAEGRSRSREVPLLMATRAAVGDINKEGMAGLLLGAGADVNYQSAGGHTALCNALASGRGNLKLIARLLCAGASLKAGRLENIRAGLDCWSLAVEYDGAWQLFIWMGLRPNEFSFWEQSDRLVKAGMRRVGRDRCEEQLMGCWIKRRLGGSADLVRFINTFIKDGGIDWWRNLLWDQKFSKDALMAAAIESDGAKRQKTAQPL